MGRKIGEIELDLKGISKEENSIGVHSIISTPKPDNSHHKVSLFIRGENFLNKHTMVGVSMTKAEAIRLIKMLEEAI